MPSPRCRSLPLALAAGLAGAATAQVPPPAGFGEEVVVDELLIEAIVVAPDGLPAPDLRREEFRVFSGERELSLHDATYYSFTEAPPPGSAPGAEPHPVESRKFVLFFDVPRTALQATAFAQARRAARAWVESDLLAADFVAVAGRDGDLELAVDFTRDRAAVAEWLVPSGAAPPSALARAPADAPSLRAELAAIGPDAPARTLGDALRRLAVAASRLPGRKNVLLFPAGGDGGEDLEPARLALNSANTAIYGFQLVGNRAWARTLARLCAGTSGAFYERFDQGREKLRRVERELRGYYLLSVTPEPGHPLRESDYRHLRVETSRGHLRVRALPSQRPVR